MGIRINSAVAYGVEFTDREARLYEKAMKNRPRNFLLMKWVEAAFDRINKGKDCACFKAYNFAKFNKRTNKPMKPLRPFWLGKSPEYLIDEACRNLRENDRESEARSFDNFRLWEPDNDRECKPARILSFVYGRNYATDIDYGWIDFLGLEGTEDRVIALKGKRPWECGTEKTRTGWATVNGQHMVPERFLPKNKVEEIQTKILGQHGGSRAEFIRKKKEIWDKYHGNAKPYPTYYGDGWHGADFYFEPVDLLYKLVSQLVPGIKYDVMRLEKHICLYWS